MRKKIRLKISNIAYILNANLICGANTNLIESLKQSLINELTIETTQRKNKGIITTGITAQSLNNAIRNQFKNSLSFHSEVYVKDGILFESNNYKGFDFAQYDENYNFGKIYNYYLGKDAIYDGFERIKMIQNINKENLDRFINNIHLEVHEDINNIKETHTIVGEIQFGNWGLIYRDLFRLMDADNQIGIDLYIYIVADGQLSKDLSTNTVCYKNAYEILNNNAKLYKVPTILIGIDYD